jgi:hypothetical protein
MSAKSIDRIYYALNKIEDKSVATMGYADWRRLVRPDGRLTELEELPSAINNQFLAATTITAVASGIAVPQPGMDVLRYDVRDGPYVINLDHYTIIENIHLHDVYSEALRVAKLEDTPQLRWELQNSVYVIKEPPNENHWMKDFPGYVLDALKRCGPHEDHPTECEV